MPPTAERARSRRRRRTRCGSSAPSSTRCSSGASSTATTTGWGTSRASSPSSTTSSGSVSTACGCCPSTRRRCATAATTSATTPRCTPSRAPSTTSSDLLTEAHARGIRVIADLVINHTSDQHPWFVESRQSRDNPKADWYVWNDDDQRWPEARVVFIDVERSNWSYDAARDQYYWHRFYAHQPDLNYDNPDVADAMLEVVRFWLDLGLDGFRLDAVPYLYQRDGTAGENLPETHAFIKRVRAELDTKYPGRILLAEANGWPADVADYFGDDDECHLCFNFPLMPRLFLAVRREQAYPITEILSQTPEAPARRPVGDLPPQPRRADARDGDRGGARLPLRRVRQGPADEAPHGDRPPAGPPPRPRPAAVRAAVLPPVHPPGEPGPLLRRRDPDGRQPLPRRPRLGADADAVVARPQRRLQPGRLRPAVPAPADGPDLRVRRRQRRGPAAQSELVPALDAADAGRPPAVPGVRDRDRCRW